MVVLAVVNKRAKVQLEKREGVNHRFCVGRRMVVRSRIGQATS